MFTKSAAFYDAIYAAVGKDYAREGQQIHAFVQQHKRSAGTRLLDVACGTGNHLAVLRAWYDVEGLDLDPHMLAIARQHCPGIRFHRAQMSEFRLGRTFDIVTCLFSSIGYVQSVPRLRRTLATFARHTVPGGVVLVEPWIRPDRFEAGHLGAAFVDLPNFKLARINTSTRVGRRCILQFHYLVGSRGRVTHFTENHVLGLFTHADYVEAFRAAGLEVSHYAEGLIGRGLYIGRKPSH
jgi:SAM-dependent methyltransferase